MKTQKEILVAFLAVVFILFSCASGFAELKLGDYTLSGDVELGGAFFLNAPSHADRGYFEEYIPYPTGFLLDQFNLSLTNGDGDQYYRFFMSMPGYRDQDFFFEAGKIGVYNAQLEYDQLQHLYCTANPNQDQIMILVQRLRFSADYTPTPNIDVFAKDSFIKRTGEQPASYGASPTAGGYSFSAYLRPLDYTQNDMKVGLEYAQPIYQFRLAYSLSLFQDGIQDFEVNPSAFVVLPPDNMAQYVSGAGALNLPAFKTRISSSFSYGWLTQDDTVMDEGGNAIGDANLSASTVAGYISGITRPCQQLSLKYYYRAYDFENDNLTNPLLLYAFGRPTRFSPAGMYLPLLKMEQYSYLRQTVGLAADWKLSSKAAFDLGYTYQNVHRDFQQGDSSSNAPRIGFRLFPYDWLNLIANYTYTDRNGSDFLGIAPGNELTYKFYSGDDKRNVVNFIAEAFPLNNVTFSVNFSLYSDDFSNSGYGLLNDHGWSPGADVSWTPFDRLSLTLGYDHEQESTKELATSTDFNGEGFLVTGDSGPLLYTSNSYDTVTGRADFVIIPEKLKLTTRASYSYSSSDFHNPILPDLNESFAHLDTFLKYTFNKHWACRGGYIFEIFNMTDAYQKLYLNGIPSTADQSLNTLDGFYRDYTAHVFEGFLQYKF